MKLVTSFGEFEISVNEFKELIEANNKPIKRDFVEKKEFKEDRLNSSELLTSSKYNGKELVNYINNSNGQIMFFSELGSVFGRHNGTFTSLINMLVGKGYLKKAGHGKYISVKFIDNIGFYRARLTNEHKRWNMADRSYLKKLSNEGMSIKELTKIFGRTPHSIYCQLTKVNNNKNCCTDSGYLKSSYYLNEVRGNRK